MLVDIHVFGNIKYATNTPWPCIVMINVGLAQAHLTRERLVEGNMSSLYISVALSVWLSLAIYSMNLLHTHTLNFTDSV